MEALRYLTDDEGSRLLERGERRTYAADEAILREGEPHEAIYIVTMGRVRVEKRTPKGVVRVDEIGVGGAFGEMSLLDGSTTSMSVIANEPVDLVVLDLLSIADLLEEDPVLASNLYHSLAVMLARRLRDRTAELLARPVPS